MQIPGSHATATTTRTAAISVDWAVLTSFTAALILVGIAWPSPEGIWRGWARILTHPSLLLSDFFTIGGPGAAFVNSGTVGLIGLSLVRASRIPLSGPTMAAVFTMAGFAFFGKTPLNILPIVAGVFLGTRLRGQEFRTALLAALFGTAIGPLVSHLAFGLGWGIVVGGAAGIVAGLMLPELAAHLVANHRGLNLYNMGFAAGILGTLAAALLAGVGEPVRTLLVLGDAYHKPLICLFAAYFCALVLVGLSLNTGGAMAFKSILKEPGTLVTDFVSIAGLPATFVNMGALGLMGLGYVVLVGGTLNGPTLGGLMTMAGFGAFGKHPRNAAPIMLGVFLGTFVTRFSPSEPGPLLAALFGTALAPVSGNFGPIAGVIAGWLHLNMVTHVTVFHGGMNLYNNGLSAGLVAIFIVVGAKIIDGIRRSGRKEAN
ncbi:MAG: DUF1576 domain-containing protein [Firmicutes bacterium]|jgi:hypothetical protein|nr:DUF1576 domain-containing protein [Bacillota bacterium]